jgi:SET and MYND domain-containing protein
MSFADLRSARQSKLSKSYIGTTNTSDISTAESIRGDDSDQARLDDDTRHAFNGLYKLLPDSLEVCSSTTSGRGIMTKDSVAPGMLQLVWTVKSLTRRLGTGSILMSAEPHVAVLSGQYLDSHCSSCCELAPSHRLKRCTRCQAIWYCDAVCMS